MPHTPEPRPDSRQELGKRGEALAVEALTAADLEIVERNWRCAAGELDIIAREMAPDYVQGGREAIWLVLVEVRTRHGARFGSALESVNGRKQAKLRDVAARYVQEHGWQGPWRIDVVAIQIDRAGGIESLEHIRHAVTAG